MVLKYEEYEILQYFCIIQSVYHQKIRDMKRATYK